MTRFYRTRYFGLAFYLLLNLVFFWPYFLRGEIPVDPNPLYRTYPWKASANDSRIHGVDPVRFLHQIDSTLMIYPLRAEVRRQMLSGGAPLWTDLIFCGAPLLANQVGALDLVSVALLPIPTFDAYGLQMILQLTLAGWFLFLFSEALGLSRPASLLAGMAYMWNAYFFRNLAVISAVGTVLWQPLLLYFVHRLWVSRSWNAFCGLAFAVMAQFLGGYAQYWIYNVGLLACYAGYLFCKNKEFRFSFFTRTVGAVVLGTILSLPQIVPFYNALKNSPRSDPATERMYEARNHLSPRKLITLAIPDFYGHSEMNAYSRLFLKPPVSGLKNIWERLLFGEYPSVYHRIWGYAGLLTLLFSLVALVRKEGRFWLFMGILPLVLLVTLNFSLPRSLFHALWEGFDRIDHTRSIVISLLSLCVLGGYGFHFLLESKTLALKFGKALGIIAASVLVIVFCMLSFVELSSSTIVNQGREHYEAGKNSAPWNENTETFAIEGIESIPRMIRSSLAILVFPLALATAAVVLAILFGRGRISSGVYAILILAASFCDLAFHGRFDPPMYFSSRETLYPHGSPPVRFLAQGAANYRVLEIQRKRPSPEPPLRSYAELGSFRTRGLKYFDFQALDFVARPDSLVFYGIPSAGGYLSIYPAVIRNLWGGRANDNVQVARPGEPIDRWSGAWIDLQSIRFILADPGSKSTRYPVVYDGPDLTIFENKSALPRAYVVSQVQSMPRADDVLGRIRSGDFDPGQTVLLDQPLELEPGDQPLQWKARIIKSFPSRVQVEVETNRDSMLVLTDTFYNGWGARVDGKNEKIYRANYAFRGVRLSAGSHQVDFRYQPPEFRIALLVSAFTLVCWTVVALWRRFRGSAFL